MLKLAKYIVIVAHVGTQQHHTNRKPRVDKDGWVHIIDTQGRRFTYHNVGMRLFIR